MKTTTLAINLVTGKAARWPRVPYSTGTDHAEFYVVYRGEHYTLASGAKHRALKIPAGQLLIFDKMYRKQIVPAAEVGIGNRIG